MSTRHHAGALVEEPFRDRLADAAGTAGDDGDLVLQAFHGHASVMGCAEIRIRTDLPAGCGKAGSDSGPGCPRSRARNPGPAVATTAQCSEPAWIFSLALKIVASASPSPLRNQTRPFSVRDSAWSTRTMRPWSMPRNTTTIPPSGPNTEG